MRELCLILIYIATVYAFLFVLMPTTVSILFFLTAVKLSFDSSFSRFLFSSNFFCRIAPVCHYLQNQKVMSRKENLISELHTKKGTWKIVVHITDLWQARKQNSKQTIEMVLMDQTGSKIGATLWQELFTELRDKLQCGSSVSPTPYLVYFLKTTSVKEIHRPEIPSNVYLITLFTNIISGLAPRHTLVDIVGVIVDLIDVKTVNPPHRMTSSSGITDKYPLSVQNIKFGSKLYVNADITEIHEFHQSLSVPFYSGGMINDKDGSQSQSSQSNVLTKSLLMLHGVRTVVLTIQRHLIHQKVAQLAILVIPVSSIQFHGWSIMGTKETSFSGMQHVSSCLAGDDIMVFPTCIDEILLKTWAVRFKFRSQLRQSSVLDVSEELHHIQSLIATLGLKEQSSKGKGIAVEPESSPPIFVPTSSDYDPGNSTCLTPTKRISCQQTSSDFDSDEHAQYQLSTNKHIKADCCINQLLMDIYAERRKRRKTILQERKRQRSATNDNLQCISQCSPTINHNNNPATSFQSTPPSHGTLSIDDSKRCSKRHAVNVSSIQRNLMSSYDNQKNITTASTSTYQASNTYSNMTQLDIHRDEHQTPTNTTQHDQFVGYDSSDSSDDDENIDIEYSLNDPTIDDLDDYDEQTFLSASSAYQNTGGTYIDIGDPVWECSHCKAMMWYDERINKDKQTNKPRFSLCCSDGKIQLPLLHEPPHPLNHLLFNNQDPKAKNFQQYIRIYNLMFAFTSPDIKFDKSYNTRKGPPTFLIHGQTHNLIGSLLPMPNNPPKFAQLYIYDTDNEIINKLSQNPMHDMLDEQIIIAIKDMLDHHNHYAQRFRMARDKLHSAVVPDLKMKLISQRQTDGRLYNLPTTTEVVALIVGDEHSADKRGIIIEKQSELLKRIHELHPAYFPLQYPLLYPKGEDGYRLNIPHKDHANIHATKRKQQWIVDGYCMIESQKLNYVRQHQQQLRVDKYINLIGSNDHPETLGRDIGKRIILPSSFVGGQRYMEQLYFDGMAICGHLGFPDLLLTMTCNPTWPEIQRKVTQSNLTPNEQKTIVDTIMSVVNTQSTAVYFLYGYGGTGKTFIWTTLSSGIRSNGGIVCTVASSGIASLLLPGGQTAHSKFAIPVPATENSTCNIHQGSELAELLKVTKLIVWDEAPMCHKFAFEALDKSLKEIMQNNLPFGGKIMVFGGDFRQILPIVPKP
ncbi:ATP-dependent DNA helicase pif1 [Glycine soja]